MDISQPIGANALDAATGPLGKPIDRVDGRLKVTGSAPYAYEYQEAGALVGYLLPATVGSGSIRSIDTAAARAAPGVALVLTHENMPSQGKDDNVQPVLKGPAIAHHGQPVALVVADTFENARAAAALVRVDYARQRGRHDGRTIRKTATKPPASMGMQPDTAVGSFADSFAKSPVRIDATYRTPDQSHAAMEPHATLAVWQAGPQGEQVTVYTANQMLNWATGGLAAALNLPKERVRVVSRYIGGGFGSKLQVEADAVLAAVAARMVGRPVKLALTRHQQFASTSRRSETEQRVRLGARADGTLVAIGHDTWCDNKPGDGFFEPAGLATRVLYAAPHRSTTHRLAVLDKLRGFAMRAPGEAVGLLALENAMDELAERLGMDPIDLRVKNEPTQDPEKKVPFSSRNLVACLREGAERFGWSQRAALPRQRREGRHWIGMGVAAASRDNPLMESRAMVLLNQAGQVKVQTSMTDIGTGTYTILAQLAAELLGVPLAAVAVELGDSAFPQGAGSGGSWGAGSSGASVYDACMQLRAQLAQRAGVDAAQATFADGTVSAGATRRTLAELMAAGPLAAQGVVKPGSNLKTHSQASYGAHFAEVAVDMDTGEARVRRMLGVFAAGRILNEKTARSQCLGGMIFGVGTALGEELVTDLRSGAFVNRDLAEYHVPVHADIPAIDAVFLPELDPRSNPMKSKGVGELGICGAGAAVTNAIYNACGVRVRDYPVTLDKLLPGLMKA